MSASPQEIVEMDTEKEQTPEPGQSPVSQSDEVAPENVEADESVTSELELPCWSIATFEGVAVNGLSYAEARKWLEKLSQQKISGLCIVTDEAAARMAK